jgi:hypothetical protein
VRRRAEHASAYGVEGADPHSSRILPEQTADAFPHLTGGLVRERHREDRARVNPFDVDEAGDARRQHAGLPRAGAGQNQQRSVDVQHGFALRRIESGGEFFLEQRRHQ